MAATFAPIEPATDAAAALMEAETIIRPDRDVVLDREEVFESKTVREVPGHGWLVVQNSGTFTAWADLSADADEWTVPNPVMLVGSFATERSATFAMTRTA